MKSTLKWTSWTGILHPARADPGVGNVTPQSFGEDDLLGETVGASSHFRADPVVEKWCSKVI